MRRSICTLPRLLNNGVQSSLASPMRATMPRMACPALSATVASRLALTPHARPLYATPATRSTQAGVAVGEPDKLFSHVEVECRGHEPAVLRSYQTFVSAAAGHLDITLEDVQWPQKHIERWTLLKSVHIYKKHRVQYEVRTHFLVMRFVRLTGSTADTFLEYIQRNLPEGVSMKVTKTELQKFPPHVKSSQDVAQQD